MGTTLRKSDPSVDIQLARNPRDLQKLVKRHFGSEKVQESPTLEGADTREIPRALDELSKLTAVLSSQLSELADRLQPILAEPVGDVTGSQIEKEVAAYRTPIAVAIGQASGVLHRCSLATQHLLRLVQV